MFTPQSTDCPVTEPKEGEPALTVQFRPLSVQAAHIVQGHGNDQNIRGKINDENIRGKILNGIQGK